MNYCMISLCLSCCLCIILPFSVGQLVTVQPKSNGWPDFYLNNTINFTCTASRFTSIIDLALFYNDDRPPDKWLAMCSSPDPCISSGCALGDVWRNKTSYPMDELAGVYEMPKLTAGNCIDYSNSSGFSIPVYMVLTDRSLRGQFFCRGQQDSSVFNSTLVTIAEVKVAPKNVTMHLPEEIIEGFEFRFNCSSEDADPLSVYSYAVNGNTTGNTTGNIYTPTKADRTGLNLSCTDIKHPYWNGASIKGQRIYPKYIDAVDKTSVSKQFRLDQPNIILNCTDYVIGNPFPHMFRWGRDGLSQTSNLSSFTLTPLQNPTTETIECIASNGIDKETVFTWDIEWIHGPTELGPIIGGSLAGVAVVVTVVIVAVVCYCCRRRKRRKEGPVRWQNNPTTSSECQRSSGNTKYQSVPDREGLREEAPDNCDIYHSYAVPDEIPAGYEIPVNRRPQEAYDDRYDYEIIERKPIDKPSVVDPIVSKNITNTYVNNYDHQEGYKSLEHQPSVKPPITDQNVCESVTDKTTNTNNDGSTSNATIIDETTNDGVVHVQIHDTARGPAEGTYIYTLPDEEDLSTTIEMEQLKAPDFSL